MASASCASTATPLVARRGAGAGKHHDPDEGRGLGCAACRALPKCCRSRAQARLGCAKNWRADHPGQIKRRTTGTGHNRAPCPAVEPSPSCAFGCWRGSSPPWGVGGIAAHPPTVHRSDLLGRRGHQWMVQTEDGAVEMGSPTWTAPCAPPLPARLRPLRPGHLLPAPAGPCRAARAGGPHCGRHGCAAACARPTALTLTCS